MITNCGFADWDASYVLGALTPPDLATYRQHLGACEACRERVSELAGMPGLLDLARPEPTLTAPVSLAVHRTKRRRRWTAGLASAAAVLVAVVLTFALLPNKPGSRPDTVVALSPQSANNLSAEAGFYPMPWGTRIELNCDYQELADGEAPDGSYALIVTDNSGVTSQISTWNAVPGKKITLQAATALSSDQISSIEVKSTQGDTLLAGKP